MKITIDVDCTPQELRSFFGLPDVAPLQAAVLEQMQSRVKEGLQPEDMERLMRLWTTGAAAGFEQFQKILSETMGEKTK